MSRRDSDSKRHTSRFDREPSPKRYRREGKQEREKEREGEEERERERDRDRDRERVTTNGGGHVDRDQRNRLPHHSKQANRDAAAADDKKSNDHNEASKHSSDPTQLLKSHSYHQHDERSRAGQVGRNTGQREAGGKAFTQSREHNEKVETGQNGELRDDKSRSKLVDNLQRRDGLSERKDDQTPTARRRPAFREKKIPVDSGEVNPATTVAAKSSHTEHHPSERNERKEEKCSNPNHLDRPEKQTADDRLPNRNGGAVRDGFSSRGRYGSSGGGSGYYRGRDKFHGRQGYHQPTAGKTRTEKWKHDLYQEVNKDPLPKNEDDQIAKLEALLAS